jgi:hypothetical protein
VRFRRPGGQPHRDASGSGSDGTLTGVQVITDKFAGGSFDGYIAVFSRRRRRRRCAATSHPPCDVSPGVSATPC